MCETPVDVEMKASGYTRVIKDDFEKLTLNKPEDVSYQQTNTNQAEPK